MAGVGVTHLKRNIYDAFLRFAQQLSREAHSQIDVVTRRRIACGALEKTLKVKLTQRCLRRQPIKAEVLGDVFGHPIRNLSQLKTGQ